MVVSNMCCKQSLKLKTISVLIIIIYTEALQQEVGEECTNKNGIVGFCEFKNKCSKDTDLGVICNSEQIIICCAKNFLKNKQNFNSSDEQKEDRSTQSRFGFIPDFFHAPILSQNPVSNNKFFNHHRQKNPNVVANVLHPNLNTMTFVEERPYQNFEKGVINKLHNNDDNQNLNIETTLDSVQTTTRRNQNHNHYLNYETQRPNRNNNNYRPYYETYPQNQNNNYNNNYPSSTSLRPNQKKNININQPYYNTNPPSQNYNNENNYPSLESQSQYPNKFTNNNQVNHAIYESNQNNFPSLTSPTPNQNKSINFSRNVNPNTQKPKNNLNSGNYDYNSHFLSSQSTLNGNEEINRPYLDSNYYSTTSSSSIIFPVDSVDDKSHTKFTTTTNRYNEYQNIPNSNTKRISEIKCEEYSKPLTTTISALPLSIDTIPKPVSIEKCNSKSVGLIVGGTKAELGEFPHMVAVGFRATSGNQWNCGGTLISERFVLTAAHCTHSALGNPVRVRLGELNLQKNNDGANPIDFLIDEIIVHPDYVPTSKYNDIALLRLDKIVKFSNHIRPACLYNNNNIYAHKVTATGWGSIEYGDRSSDDLLKVDLDIINNRQCSKLYEAESKTSTLNKGIIDSMVCAGDLAGGHDTCLGDSGGPLVIRSEKNACVFNLIGITSFGKFCATENSPGVYTRISSFLPWIEQNVWV